MSGVTTYRTKEACRVGGAYRCAGEVFTMQTLEEIPSFLDAVESAVVPEEAKVGKKAKTGKPSAVPEEAKVGKADIGAAPAVSSADVTSVDVVKQ